MHKHSSRLLKKEKIHYEGFLSCCLCVLTFNVNVRVHDTVSLVDENKYFPSRLCLLFNISTPYCLNEERHIRRERYGLHLQIVEFGKYFQHDL